MQPALKPRIFSIEEANSLIPELEKAFDDMSDMNSQLQVLSKDLRDLVNVWGDSVFSEKNLDNAYYKELLSRRDGITEELNRRISGIHSLGCVVKDIDKGLVDFYHKRDDRTIFLCWRHGEKKINFWHNVNAGYINRRHVTELARN